MQYKLSAPQKLNVCQAAVKGCLPDEEAIQWITQEGNSESCRNQQQINVGSGNSCRSQAVTRSSSSTLAKVSGLVCRREAACVIQRRAVLISMHLLCTPVYCTSNIYISRDEMEMVDAKEVFLLIVVALSHA